MLRAWIFAVQLVFIRSELSICPLARRRSANLSTKGLASKSHNMAHAAQATRKRKIAKRGGSVERKNAFVLADCPAVNPYRSFHCPASRPERHAATTWLQSMQSGKDPVQER
jgi:hypothetical protein